MSMLMWFGHYVLLVGQRLAIENAAEEWRAIARYHELAHTHRWSNERGSA